MRDFIFKAALFCFVAGILLSGAIIFDDILRRDDAAKKRYAPPHESIRAAYYAATAPIFPTPSVPLSVSGHHAVNALAYLKCPDCGIYYMDPAVLRPCVDCVTKTAHPK